jgi:hypothetical protein
LEDGTALQPVFTFNLSTLERDNAEGREKIIDVGY